MTALLTSSMNCLVYSADLKEHVIVDIKGKRVDVMATPQKAAILKGAAAVILDTPAIQRAARDEYPSTTKVPYDETAEDRHEYIQAERQKMSSYLASAQMAIDMIRKEEEYLDAEKDLIEERKRLTEGARSKVEKLNTQIGEKDAQLKQNISQIGILESDLLSAKTESDKKQQEIDVLSTQLNQATSELSATRANADELRQTHKRQSDEIEKLQELQANSGSSNEQLNAIIAEKIAENQKTKIELESLIRIRDRKDKQITQLKEIITVTQNEQQRVVEMATRCHSELQELKRETAGHQVIFDAFKEINFDEYAEEGQSKPVDASAAASSTDTQASTSEKPGAKKPVKRTPRQLVGTIDGDAK
jgi:uncharacterized protein YoaH (UPF0181 family)